MCHNLFNQSPDDRNLGYFLSFLITKKKNKVMSYLWTYIISQVCWYIQTVDQGIYRVKIQEINTKLPSKGVVPVYTPKSNYNLLFKCLPAVLCSRVQPGKVL